MKRALIIAPAIVVSLTAIALVAPSFVDWNKYKPQAVTQAKALTGYDVKLNGDLGLSILPSPRIFIENVEVAAPQGSNEDHLIRVRRLDVILALAPLLTGKIDVSSVTLVEPDIALQVFDDGRQNWMTPELDALTKKDAQANPEQTVAQKPKNAPAIALRDVSIEKGKFVYRAGKGVAPTEVSDVNVDLSADTLQGPFNINGTITTAGQTIEMDAKTGKIDKAANSIQINMNAQAKPLDALVKFSGVAGLSEPYDMQGETEIKVSSLKDKLKNSPVNIEGDAVVLKGLLTGNKNAASFKDAVIDAGGNQFKGEIAAGFAPVKLAARLNAAKPVNLDTIIKTDGAAKNTKAAKEGSSAKGAGLLPPTIELPASFEADVALTAPGLTLRGQGFKDVKLAFAKSGNVFTGGFAAAEIPGKGSVDAKADLKFASKSISKTGGEIYSDPALTGTIKGQTQNIAQTVEAFGGARNPALESFKTAAIDGSFSVATDALKLNSSTVRLGDMAMNVAAAYSPRGTRPAVALDISADTVNFNELQKKTGGGGGGEASKQPQASKGSIEETLRKISIPYDVDFDVGVQNAILQGQKITGLRAQGTARENALKFTNLSAQNFAGSSFKMEGGIGNLKDLKAIDVKFAGESSDVKGVAKMAGFDPAALPANIEKAALNATLAGDMAKMAVKASVKALNGEVIASGDVGNPLSALSISNMSVQIKHRSMSEALRIFAPSAPQYASWNKPMDLYAEIDTQGKVHNLRNIKGDLAGATVAGTFSYDQSAAKPVMKGDLTFGDLVMVSDAASAAAVTKSANTAPSSARSSGKWSSEPINAAWMNAFNADIALKAKSITYETWAFAQPSLSLILQDGALQIKDMKSGLYGGQMAMSGLLKSNAGKAPLSLDSEVKFDNVQIESLAASLARGTRLVKGSGAVSMNAKVQGTGSSQQALISSLNGGGTMSGKNIVLEGFDLVRFGRAMSEENKAKDTLLGLYKTSIKGGSTQFDTMDGAYTIAQGVVKINKLDMDGAAASLKTAGNVNLPAWTIATDHTITLKQNPEVPPFTIKLAGSLDNPGQTFGQGLIQDYLQRKATRKIENLIVDKIGGKEGDALGTLLGIGKKPAAVPTAPTAPDTAPAAGEEIAPPPVTQPDGAVAPQPVQPAPVAPAQPKSKEEQQKEAIEGVLKGLLGQ